MLVYTRKKSEPTSHINLQMYLTAQELIKLYEEHSDQLFRLSDKTKDGKAVYQNLLIRNEDGDYTLFHGLIIRNTLLGANAKLPPKSTVDNATGLIYTFREFDAADVIVYDRQREDGLDIRLAASTKETTDALNIIAEVMEDLAFEESLTVLNSYDKTSFRQVQTVSGEVLPHPLFRFRTTKKTKYYRNDDDDKNDVKTQIVDATYQSHVSGVIKFYVMTTEGKRIVGGRIDQIVVLHKDIYAEKPVNEFNLDEEYCGLARGPIQRVL